MVAYNFQRQFVRPVWDGSKPQTMRVNGDRRPARKGEMLQLYYGQRTKACFKVLEVRCTEALPIEIHQEGLRVWTSGTKGAGSRATIILEPEVLDAFAQLDGFENFGNLLAWFDNTHGLPATNLTLLRWNPAHALYRATSAQVEALDP